MWNQGLFVGVTVLATFFTASYSFSPTIPNKCASTSPLFTDLTHAFPKHNKEDRLNNICHTSKISYGHISARSSSASSSNNESSGTASKTEKKMTRVVDERSIFERFDDYCLALKPRALEANEKAETFVEQQGKRILYKAKSCALFSLFIVYRGYRGFFYILPAVFREVYQKMEKAVKDPFDDDGMNGEPVNGDVNPDTGVVRLRTRVVVSVLTCLVTLSYVVTGAFRVLIKFLATATRTSSVEPAFEAAVDQVLSNEGKMMKMADVKEKPVNGAKLPNANKLSP